MKEKRKGTDDYKTIQENVEAEFARFINTSPEAPLILGIAIDIQNELHRYYERAPESTVSVLYEDEEKLIVQSDPVWTVRWAGDWGMISESLVVEIMSVLSSAHYNYAREIMGDALADYRTTDIFIVLK